MPPLYPDTTFCTPFICWNTASVHQKQPDPNVATSVSVSGKRRVGCQIRGVGGGEVLRHVELRAGEGTGDEHDNDNRDEQDDHQQCRFHDDSGNET